MEKRCYFCGTVSALHRHHVFGGTANRKQSEKYGMVAFLCAPHHNMSNMSVHFNREMDLELKRAYQAEFEKVHSREEFRQIFGKSWL